VPIAYSYIRFSTPDQILGDSLRRQTEASNQYAIEHGLTLDETLNIRDLGVSAFKGNNFETGALGQFLVAIDDGRVAKDSYLLVESLDRLSRLPVTEALAIFQAIIGRGITIVTLIDSAIYSKERLRNDWTPLLIALVTMSRAHEESAVKSRRIKAAWEAKKVRVKSNKEVMSGRCPWWLKLSDDKSKYEIVEEKADSRFDRMTHGDEIPEPCVQVVIPNSFCKNIDVTFVRRVDRFNHVRVLICQSFSHTAISVNGEGHFSIDNGPS